MHDMTNLSPSPTQSQDREREEVSPEVVERGGGTGVAKKFIQLVHALLMS